MRIEQTMMGLRAFRQLQEYTVIMRPHTLEVTEVTGNPTEVPEQSIKGKP